MVISLHSILLMSLYDFVIISIFLFFLWTLSLALPSDNSRELSLLMSAGISVGFLPSVDIIHPLSHPLYLFLCFVSVSHNENFLFVLFKDLIEEQHDHTMYRTQPVFHQRKLYFLLRVNLYIYKQVFFIISWILYLNKNQDHEDLYKIGVFDNMALSFHIPCAILHPGLS